MPSVRSATDLVREVVSHPTFPDNIDAQVRVLDWLHEALTKGATQQDLLATNPDLNHLVTSLATAIGESPQRIATLAAMDSRIDRRRGLKVRVEVEPPRRKAHELVYPTTGWLGAYLDQALLTEQPLAWHFWLASFVLGAACRRNVYIDMGFSKPLFLNQYVMLVGPTGRGKNEVMDRATSLLEGANVAAGRASVEAGFDRRVPIIKDVTAEGLMDTLSPQRTRSDTGATLEQDQSIAAIVNPEASTIIGKTKESAERLITLATELYAIEPQRTRTRGRGWVELGYGALSLALGSTAEWIVDSITGSLISGGFTGRCIFIGRGGTERILYQDYEPGQGWDPAVRHALSNALVPWMMAPEMEAVNSPQAEDFYRGWYMDHRKQPTPDVALEGYWQRKPAHVRKLAATLAVSDLCDVTAQAGDLAGRPSLAVTETHLTKAMDLLAIEEARLPEVFADLDRHPETRTVEYVKQKIADLTQQDGQPPTRTRLSQTVRHRVGTSRNLDKFVRTLQEAGELTITTSGRGVRYHLKESPSEEP